MPTNVFVDRQPVAQPALQSALIKLQTLTRHENQYQSITTLSVCVCAVCIVTDAIHQSVLNALPPDAVPIPPEFAYIKMDREPEQTSNDKIVNIGENVGQGVTVNINPCYAWCVVLDCQFRSAKVFSPDSQCIPDIDYVTSSLSFNARCVNRTDSSCVNCCVWWNFRPNVFLIIVYFII